MLRHALDGSSGGPYGTEFQLPTIVNRLKTHPQINFASFPGLPVLSSGITSQNKLSTHKFLSQTLLSEENSEEKTKEKNEWMNEWTND